MWWIDIIEQKLYSADSGGSTLSVLPLNVCPGAVLDVDHRQVLICGDAGILRVDRASGTQEIVARMPGGFASSELRANDGVKDSRGIHWFGTMERNPTGLNGAVYSYDGESVELRSGGLGIPNLFVELHCGDLLIADSYEKLVFRYCRTTNGFDFRSPKVWRDFSREEFTPDGGCIDQNGRVYIAHWDGASIGVYGSDGVHLNTIEVPVPRPTNCKLDSMGRLYVSSARVGLSADEQSKFPLSGSVFVFELEALGA